MIYTVYVLRDDGGKFYKGLTSDIERRLNEHRSGGTRTTKKMSGLGVVYTEKYDNVKQARQREKYLKSAAGRRFLKKKGL